jgi:hypothetical protein
MKSKHIRIGVWGGVAAVAVGMSGYIAALHYNTSEEARKSRNGISPEMQYHFDLQRSAERFSHQPVLTNEGWVRPGPPSASPYRSSIPVRP